MKKESWKNLVNLIIIAVLAISFTQCQTEVNGLDQNDLTNELTALRSADLSPAVTVDMCECISTNYPYEEDLSEGCSDNEVFENKQQPKRKLNEAKVKAFILEKHKQIVVAENKIKSLEAQLVEQTALVETLQNENGQYVEVLQEAKGTINNLALTNTKMAHISQLFTNYSTTTDEKKQIAESFDTDVATINESKLAYKMWKTKLVGQEGKKKLPLDTSFKLSENTGKKVDKKKTLIKEEKTYQNPNEQDQFDRFSKYEN